MPTRSGLQDIERATSPLKRGSSIQACRIVSKCHVTWRTTSVRVLRHLLGDSSILLCGCIARNALLPFRPTNRLVDREMFAGDHVPVKEGKGVCAARDRVKKHGSRNCLNHGVLVLAQDASDSVDDQ